MSQTSQAPKVITIVTHNGNFHADDVFAVAMLQMAIRKALPDAAVRIIRTRDNGMINQSDFVVDVGGKYDPQQGLFDHHQKEGAGSRSNGVPFASAGLVWAEFGESLCGNKAVAEEVDRLIIQKLDAADCGYSGQNLDRTYSSIISDFNPSWDDNSGLIDEAFANAVKFAKQVLSNAIGHAIADQKARQIVINDSIVDGRVLILDSYIPWSEAVIGQMPEILFAVFPDLVGSWKVQGVPLKIGSFENRLRLPAEWAGLQGADLDKVAGIDGCVFCHNGRFIAGHATKAGAIALAKKAVQDDVLRKQSF